MEKVKLIAVVTSLVVMAVGVIIGIVSKPKRYMPCEFPENW